MFRLRMMLNAAAFAVAALALSPHAHAQAPHTFVSALTGDDSYPCSPTLPCRSIKQALSLTQAKGKVVIIDSGEYDPFKVGQSVSVEAAPGVYAGITATLGIAVTVTAGTSDVVSLRGLTLLGAGGAEGITFKSGGALHVEGCLISGFTGDGIRFVGAGRLFVKDTTSRNNGHGILIDPAPGAATALIDRCRLEKNAFVGLFVSSNARVTARDTVAAGNGGGFKAISGLPGLAAELNLEGCAAAGNFLGIHSEGGNGGAALVRVSNTTVTNNDKGLFSAGAAPGSILSRGNNTVEGNAVNGSFTGAFNPQ